MLSQTITREKGNRAEMIKVGKVEGQEEFRMKLMMMTKASDHDHKGGM